MSNKLRQQIIGFCVLFFLGLYVCIICTGHADRWRSLSETSLRLSVLLGVIWLAWDDILRIPKCLYVFAPIILLSVIVFPKIGPIVIIILIPVWLLIKFLRYLAEPLPPQQGGPKKK